MKAIRPALLTVFAFGSSLLQAPGLLAAQRPSEMALYGEIERFLSPNELQLAELQRERQDLLQNRDSEKNPRILKNKITILNNKIAFLQRQIKLTKPYMVTQRLVPIRVKGAQSAHRLEPAEAPVSAPIVAAPKVAAPVAAVKPVAVRPTPIVLAPKNFYVTEKREDAVLGMLPRKLDTKPFAVSALREEAAEKSVAALSSGERKPGVGKTGAEWKKMELADKEIYILSVMGSLSRRDVYLMKPYSFYIQNIDEAIVKNPLLEQEYVHRILMTTAYDSEPDTRKDLEKVWQ